MKKEFNHIALIGKYQDKEMREHIIALAEFLRARHLLVTLETETARCGDITDYPVIALAQMNAQVDLAIVLGGDGTMLGVARALLEHQVPLLGVNRGRIGFLTDISAQSMLEDVAKVLAGDYTIESRLMLHTKIMRKGQLLGEGVALNDVVISKGEVAQLMDLEVMIDGHFVHRQRSDGLIIATPTGTTAYALSAGGPILHSALEAIALVPICPHTLSNRPIVIKSTSQVHVKLVDKDESRIHFDGQLIARLYQNDDVYISRAEKMTPLLHPNGHCHYEMLRKKLHWG
ncbi:MAG: NAD kinase [Methylotenera sp.]